MHINTKKIIMSLIPILFTACGNGGNVSSENNILAEQPTIVNETVKQINGQVLKVEIIEDHTEGTYFLKDLHITMTNGEREVFYSNVDVKAGDVCRMEDDLFICGQEIVDVIGYKNLTRENH